MAIYSLDSERLQNLQGIQSNVTVGFCQIRVIESILEAKVTANG